MSPDALLAFARKGQLEAFADLVDEMRAAQRACSRAPSGTHFAEANRLERQVDARLAELGLVGAAQGRLPCGGA
jgi:hypothetical protein